MRSLEIIQLRSSATPLERLNEQIKKSIGSINEQAEVVTIYRRGGLETDLAVHIERIGYFVIPTIEWVNLRLPRTRASFWKNEYMKLKKRLEKEE